MDSLRVLVFVGTGTDKSLVLWVLQNSSMEIEIEDLSLKSDLLSTLVQNEFDCIITQGSRAGEYGKILWDTLTNTKQLIPIIFLKQKADEPLVFPATDSQFLLTHSIGIKDFSEEFLKNSVDKSNKILHLIEENRKNHSEKEFFQHYSNVLAKEQSLGSFRVDKEGDLLHISDPESFSVISPDYQPNHQQKFWAVMGIDLGLELIWKRFEKGDENSVQKRVSRSDYELELNLVPRMDGMLFEGLDGYYKLTKLTNDIELDAAINQLKKDEIREYEAKLLRLEKKIDDLAKQLEEKQHKISTQQGSIDRYKSVLSAIPGYAFRVLEKSEGGLAISYIDQELMELLGWDVEAVEGLDRRLADSMDPRFLELLLNRIKQAKSNNGQFSSFIPVKNQSGEWQNFKIKATPSTQLTGNIFWSGIVFPVDSEESDKPSVAIDTSKSAMEQIKSLVNDREAALEQVRIKSEFLYSMSDEIRLPIERILNMLEAILLSSEDSGIEEYIDLALSAANNVISIINDIQDYAELESERLGLNNIAFNIRYLLKDVCSQFDGVIQEKQLNLCTVTSGKIPNSVVADPGRIRQILSYLINNAILDTQKGEITVRLEIIEKSGKQELFFQVIDSGREITADDRRYLFHLYSVDSDERDIQRKSGLQLAVARQLSELMGGELGFNTNDDGACFWIRVPIESTAQQLTPIGGRESYRLNNARIALISKKKDNQLARWMYSWNVGLDVFDDADRGLEKMLERAIVNLNYHILVVDCQSQNEIDYELIHIVKNDAELNTCKIVLLVPSGIRGDSQKSQQLGVSALLTKPVNYELFQAALEAVMKQPLATSNLITRYSLVDWQPSEIGHVLIADTDDRRQRELSRDLQSLGYTTDIAVSGEEVLEVLDNNPYNIVIIDKEIPLLDALAVCKKIREREKSDLSRIPIKIVAMVGEVKSQETECRVAGMDGCFVYEGIESLEEQLRRVIPSHEGIASL